MTGAHRVLAVLSLTAIPTACTIGVIGEGPGGTGGAGTGGGAGGTGTPITADQCNPVTGAGCPADGSACDLDEVSGFFTCFPPPNTVGVCGQCDGETFTCGPNLTCLEAAGASSPSCYRYCCSNGDCDPGSTCDTALAASLLHPASPADAVGVCAANASTQAPACGPPGTSPSGGTCVGGYSTSPDGGTPDAGPPGADGGEPDGGEPSDGSAPPADGGLSDGG